MTPITLEEMKAVKLMNRTDTKFLTGVAELEELLRMIDDDYYVQIADGVEYAPYHTLYFDTLDCRMYLTHHNGKKMRQKLRIRTYVASGEHFLEVKTKDNHGKTKKKRASLGVSLTGGDEGLCQALLHAHPLEAERDFLSERLWLAGEVLEPKIENAFTRITLVNKGKTERLTIDRDLRFHNLTTGERRDMGNLVIIELKRNSLQASPILPRLNRLRIFQSGFSKYCMGMALTDGRLKQNRFKERLRAVEKLCRWPMR